MGGMGGMRFGLGGGLGGSPLENSRSFNLSGIIRDTSLTDLGVNFGSTSDLSALGLFSSKSDLSSLMMRDTSIGNMRMPSTDGLKLTSDLRLNSELRDVNASEMSISGLLNESASEIVSGLAKRNESFTQARTASNGQQDQLLDIMQDFGAAPMATVGGA